MKDDADASEWELNLADAMKQGDYQEIVRLAREAFDYIKKLEEECRHESID